MSATDLVRALHDYNGNVISTGQLRTEVLSHRALVQENKISRKKYALLPELWATFSSTLSTQTNTLTTVEDNEDAIAVITYIFAMVMTLCCFSPENQHAAGHAVEPYIYPILLYVSSFFNIQNEKYRNMTRIGCQALCNIFTDNEEITSMVFSNVLQQQDSNQLITRLLASPDIDTHTSVLVIVLNLIHNSSSRAQILAQQGHAIINHILSDAQNDEDKSENDMLFELSFSIVKQYFTDAALFALVFDAQAMEDAEVNLSDTQIALLKFVDGHLHNLLMSAETTGADPLPLLILPFACEKSLVLANSLTAEEEYEKLQPRALHGMVLLTHIMCSVALLVTPDERLRIICVLESIIKLWKTCEDLRLPPDSVANASVIAPITRNSVRLVGILSESSNEAREITRTTGGLVSLLNQCKIQDGNPTLREHSILSLKNVLKDNEENQDFVRKLEPKFLVGQDGQLSELPVV